MSKYTASIHEDEIFSSIAYKELLNKKEGYYKNLYDKQFSLEPVS